MIALVAVLLLLGVLLGAVAQIPLSASAVGAAAIGAWLLVFALRERRARRRAH
ncbi:MULTISPECIES: hypothetical protein [unclassified Streptomyces]|uniref:hypothetical protein n=1 Tax=unclassified Streptomyces TaxID=2593676 RepID=UPI0021CA50D8|nr:hypothetical protein [Streptomyces sp. FIT100]UUN29301.1 hypothetical protein KK483_25160 [Streptomyces sp. FIT100]